MRRACLIFALLLEACRVCNEAGCDSMLTVQLRGPNGAALEHGAYQISIVVDGEAQQGSCTVAESGSQCDGLDGALFVPSYGGVSNNLIEIRIEDDPPAEMEISVMLDGAPVLTAELEPIYERRGDYCDESCVFATERLDLNG